MPFQEVSIVSQRKEFVNLARADDANISELCQRFGISRPTGYKWLNRSQQESQDALTDRSRRPHSSPGRTDPSVEQAVLDVRQAHPAWGGRKIRQWLKVRSHIDPPAPSTITAILRRHDRISPQESVKHKPYKRFEYEAPNELWQMDFKGNFPLTQGRCYPLTILDDHSRYSLGIEACPNERGQTVKERLTRVFRLYGLPERMVMDNGNPWGTQGAPGYSAFEVWLMRLGIRVYHGRPFHPQTQGKDERFHRTLMAEAIVGKAFRDIEQCQIEFDQYRVIYNHERPHEALGMEVPSSRYRVSGRGFPETLPAIEYGPEGLLRKVQAKGEISFRNTEYHIGVAFKGLPVALKPTGQDGIWDIYFMTHVISRIDLQNRQPIH